MTGRIAFIPARYLWCLAILLLAAFWAPPTRGGEIGRGAMALGLAAVVDWSTQQPFLDVMKTSRPWIGHRPGQWGGMTEADLDAAGVLDADGWPTEIPRALRGIGTVVLTDLPEAAVSMAGRYRLRFDGDGIVEVGGRGTNVRYGKGEILFDFAPGPGSVIVTINRTDRRKTGDYIRNMSLVRLDRADRLDAGEVFNPDWLARIDGFGALRFMDWMDTNGSDRAEWQDRPRPGDYTYTRHGVPLEILLRLANETGADPWFNMPHMATEDYMRRYAETVRDGLDPGLTAYVEYSNEVWNWQFEQASWAEDRARERWGREYAWMQFYGLRTAQMAEIWKQAFGPAAAQRLVTVISTQTGWQGLEADALEAPLWVAENPARNRAPAAHVDAYAIAGYFGRALGDPDRAAIVHGWLDDSLGAAQSRARVAGLTGEALDRALAETRFDVAIDLAIRDLRDGAVTGLQEDTLAALANSVFPYHAGVASRYGLDLIMYEGGSHIAGHGETIDDDALTAFFIALNYSPQMGALYTELLDIWARAGGRLFNAFVDVGTPSKWGSWGALRYLDDATSRWEALHGAR